MLVSAAAAVTIVGARVFDDVTHRPGGYNLRIGVIAMAGSVMLAVPVST